MALRSSLSSTWNVSHVSKVFSIWLTEKSSSNIRRPKLQISDTCCHLRLLNPKLSLLQSFTNSSTSRIPERLCMLSREVKPWPLTLHSFPGSASYWSFSLAFLFGISTECPFVFGNASRKASVSWQYVNNESQALGQRHELHIRLLGPLFQRLWSRESCRRWFWQKCCHHLQVRSVFENQKWFQFGRTTLNLGSGCSLRCLVPPWAKQPATSLRLLGGSRHSASHSPSPTENFAFSLKAATPGLGWSIQRQIHETSPWEWKAVLRRWQRLNISSCFILSCSEVLLVPQWCDWIAFICIYLIICLDQSWSISSFRLYPHPPNMLRSINHVSESKEH